MSASTGSPQAAQRAHLLRLIEERRAGGWRANAERRARNRTILTETMAAVVPSGERHRMTAAQHRAEAAALARAEAAAIELGLDRLAVAAALIDAERVDVPAAPDPAHSAIPVQASDTPPPHLHDVDTLHSAPRPGPSTA